jgi:hypothetical protein
VRLLFDLLSSCSGLLKHAAATTSAAVTIPAVDVQRAAADLDSCAVNGHRWQSPRRLLLPRRTTAPPSKTEVAAARGAVALAAGDAATALPLLRNPVCSMWCRLAWQRAMSLARSQSVLPAASPRSTRRARSATRCETAPRRSPVSLIGGAVISRSPSAPLFRCRVS